MATTGWDSETLCHDLAALRARARAAAEADRSGQAATGTATARAAGTPGMVGAARAGWVSFTVELGWPRHERELGIAGLDGGYVCALCAIPDAVGVPAVSLEYDEHVDVEHPVGTWEARVCRVCVDRVAEDATDLVDALEQHALALGEHCAAEQDTARRNQRRGRASWAAVRIKEAQLDAAEQMLAATTGPLLHALGCDPSSIRAALAELTADTELANAVLAARAAIQHEGTTP